MSASGQEDDKPSDADVMRDMLVLEGIQRERLLVLSTVAGSYAKRRPPDRRSLLLASLSSAIVVGS